MKPASTAEGRHSWDLGAGAHLLLEPGFLSGPEATELLRVLVATLAWEQGSVRFFGKTVLEPRLSAWFGDHDYTYSGRTLVARPWPDALQSLRAHVQAASGATFNSVLVNRYRSGRDSMGFHSDDEPELGRNPTIASVSLGAPRRFVLKPKRLSDALTTTSLILPHGSLLVMSGTCQHTFRHAVPKQQHASGERINLTFRRIATP